MRRNLLILGLLCTVAVGARDRETRFTGEKLRVYCKACHGVGNLRFIYSDDPDAIWNYILHNNVPGKSDLWSKRILEVLDWPSDEPPPVEQTDWMPKGIKRIKLAEDYENEESSRRRMVRTLLNYVTH